MAKALGTQASAKRSQPYCLDVTFPRANKGAVVDELVKTLGMPAKEIATIGDMLSDPLMFERRGFSMAMSNAGDEAKSRASAVTDSYNDEGFTRAVEPHILHSGA